MGSQQGWVLHVVLLELSSRSLNQKGLENSESVSQARWAGLQDDAGVDLVDPSIPHGRDGVPTWPLSD